jgi:predicted acylesterase/phospholipase RssA
MAHMLQERYDLQKVPMAGASSGAIVACLAACGVDTDLVFEEAFKLAKDNDIWNRKFGLLGIWGGLIRDWLHKLLPENAHELVSGRLHVVIAKAPTLDLFEVRATCC